MVQTGLDCFGVSTQAFLLQAAVLFLVMQCQSGEF